MGQAAFLPNLFLKVMTTIFTPMKRHIIYLAALAGTYLDILFRGVNLLTDNHNNIVSGGHYTHIIDELNIVWACLFTNI